MGGRRMTLSFSTTWPERMGELAGQPNHFIPKIWKSFLKGVWMNANEFTEKFDALSDVDQCKINDVKPKLHTIRKDENNRWEAGVDIHMVINNRTKNRLQFVPVVKCVSTQDIKIEYVKEIRRYYSWTDIWKNGDRKICVYVNNRMLNANETIVLAITDGFDSVEDFFAYFDTDFIGKIIHWTDLKY